MKERIIYYLSTLSIVYHHIDNNIIAFKYHGLNYAFQIDPEVKYYFRLILPNIGTRNEKTLTILNELNASYKVAKAFVVKQSVWVVVEFFLSSYENVFFLFDRSLELLPLVEKDFKNRTRINYE